MFVFFDSSPQIAALVGLSVNTFAFVRCKHLNYVLAAVLKSSHPNRSYLASLAGKDPVGAARDKRRKLPHGCKQWRLQVLQCQWFSHNWAAFPLCRVSPCSVRKTRTVSSRFQWQGRDLIGLCGKYGGQAPFSSSFKRLSVSRFPIDMNWIWCVRRCHY